MTNGHELSGWGVGWGEMLEGGKVQGRGGMKGRKKTGTTAIA